MKFGVIVFPGSTCDHDAYNVVAEIAKQPCSMIWHESEDLQGADAIIVPGGFAYGDYLRTGAIAAFAPAMKAVKKFAAQGGLVIGICNGFQILCEAALLPGALVRNRSLSFVCDTVTVRVETSDTPYTMGCRVGELLSLPIKHGEGCYVADEETLAALESERRIVLHYTNRGDPAI